MSYSHAHAEAAVTRAKLGHFFNELRRRKVFQVLAGYIVGALGLIQLSSSLLPAFDLSAHYTFYVLIALLVGLPVAMALSWRYELTSIGLKLTTPDDPNPPTE